MTDLDLRLVRYFIAVASHRSFGRAATELHVAQPSLSRQIGQLEARLGVRLLDRSTRGTSVSAAGAAFLPHAKALLREADHGTSAARAAVSPTRLVVGYTDGLLITPTMQRFRHDRPDADVQVLHLDWNQPRPALLDGRVDAVITRLPLAADGLQINPLCDEPRVLLVSVHHRLARQHAVSLTDIADEPIPQFSDAAFDAYWRIDPRPDGRPAPGGPTVRTVEDKAEAVASGEAVAIIPAAFHAVGLRPDLTTVPMSDAPPAQIVLATRADDQRPLIHEFAALATTTMRESPTT